MMPQLLGEGGGGISISLGRLIAAGGLASIMTAIGCGAFRLRGSCDPPRLDPNTPLKDFLLLIPTAIVAFFLAVVGRFVMLDMLGDVDIYFERGSWWYVFFAYLPFAAAGNALTYFDRVILGEDTSKRLGYSIRTLPIGVLQGVLGAVIVFGPMLGVMVLTTLTHRAEGYTHSADSSLQLLKHDREHPIGKVFLIFNLVWGVPFVEELFFRGHLQTALREAIIRLRIAAYLPRRWADDGATDNRHFWATACALIITSMAFAALHPEWTWPQTFFLGICLGYAYERTGNLYASMTIHGLFNASQIVWVLSSPQ